MRGSSAIAARPVRLAALAAAIVLIGWLDYTTGPDIGFSLFYLGPVLAAGWLDGAVPAAALGVAASTAWFAADYFWHHTPVAVTAWNGFTRLAIFVAMGVMMSRLRRERERMRKANEELEAFTYSVSHDLRSPLVHIGSFADALARRSRAALDDEGRHYLATVSDSAALALKLIDDLLDFSRLGRAEVKRSPVSLSAVVAEVRQQLSSTLEPRVVHWNVGALPTVAGDAAMLRLAVHNLLENALKYTRPRAEAVLEIGSARQDDEVVIHIRDNGVGFDQKHGGKLFRVFERLHDEREFEGRGIGLATVSRIVARHGGRTWAEGRVGEGATFYFSLPVS